MRIAFFGDVVGKVGRRGVVRCLKVLRDADVIDFVIANCENSAGGVGVDPGSARELLAAGIDVLTSGNHIWAKREIVEYLTDSDVLLRPANFAPTNPGWGYTVKVGRNGMPVAVVNLIGRVFMNTYDCPFRSADAVLESLGDRARVIVVDMHAEATSEKVAMGWHLDGRVAAVIGTHTHVQTADERVLPGGTACLTDAGMTGPHDGVIGMDKDAVIARFVTGLPGRFDAAGGDPRLHGVIVTADPSTGRASAIQRLSLTPED